MKLACLLAAAGGIVPLRRDENPFRATELGRLPFLVQVKPVSLAPVLPALEERRAAAPRGEVAGRLGGFGAIVLRAVGALFVLAVLVCGLGAQRIAYAREKTALGRQLRQSEDELRVVTQACQSLEAQRALQVAWSFAQVPAPPPRLESRRGNVAVASVRTGSGRESRPVVGKAAGRVLLGQPARVADARGAARRGGVRG
jgi:hypothetical protein